LPLEREQNDCSESFETRQGLRQGDVLSTLLFNVVLPVIVRRANLQTTGSIYNKETKLLAYADNIDIVGRGQSAVRDAYLALEGEAAKEGLKIYEQKTKYMIAARNDTTIRDVGFLVTNTLKSSKNLCTYNEESRLQIGASLDCTNICSRATFHARQY
jgi:hypothetical protein